MVQLNTLTSTMNSFSFDLITSSGDTISLSLYDNKSLAYESFESEGSSGFSMSLKHEFGYSFSYRGDGIDAQDMKEIEKAMKSVKPLFKNFLENVKESEKRISTADILKTAASLKDLLPDPKGAQMQNMLKSKTVDTMDTVLSLFERNDKLIDAAKRLFDQVFKSVKRFEVYA